MKIFKSLFFLIFSFTLASCTKNHDTNFYERLKSAVEAGNEKKMENKNQEMLDYFFSFQDIYEKIRLSPKTPITIINYFNSSFGKEIIYRLKNEKLNFEDGEPYFHIALDIQEFNSIPWLVKKGARVDVAADYYNVRLAPEEFALYLSERLSHDYTGEGITDSDSQLSEEYKKWAKYFDDIKQTSTHSK